MKSITQWHLSKNRHKFPRYAGKKLRIYSREWGAWWRPDASGYTSNENEAGIYTFEDAVDRSMHCGPEKKIIYQFIQSEPSQLARR